jgi:hypothetical protein
MIDLKLLLARAQAHVENDKKMKLERDRLKRGGLSDKERNAISDKLREWQSVNDYQAVELVFRDLHYVCACGGVVIGGGQMLIHERHIRIASAGRYLPVHPPYRADLPRVRDFTVVKVETCRECITTLFGFPEEAK